MTWRCDDPTKNINRNNIQIAVGMKATIMFGWILVKFGGQEWWKFGQNVEF